ncbi:hypothetical protein C8R46DRAFT_1357931 [Mycena filopes]|nr:hypothetical protein C8R46DRAFT_1357931 [Mycena filopes]
MENIRKSDFSAGTKAGTHPKGVSASEWAATEDGRATFRAQFNIRRGAWTRADYDATQILCNSTGHDPLHEILAAAPSIAWMRVQSEELHALLSDKGSYNLPLTRGNFPMARGIKAQFLATITPYLNDPEGPNDYDAALTANLDVLLQACVHVRQIRGVVPPANEQAWTPVVNAIIDAALAPYSWVFENHGLRHGKPRPQALPRRFARSKCETIYDPQNLPRQFQPDRGFYIAYPWNSPLLLSSRQLHCINTAKKINSSTATENKTIPAIVVEMKAQAADLPVAQGKALYSAVAAAGIAQNLDEDIRTLLLPVVHGFLNDGGEWSKKFRKRIFTCSTAKQLDLGNLYDAVHLFAIVSAAARHHVQQLYPDEDNLEALEQRKLFYKTDAPKRRMLQPKALVDWRARIIPRYSEQEKDCIGCGQRASGGQAIKKGEEE